jgi:hypothetical protein
VDGGWACAAAASATIKNRRTRFMVPSDFATLTVLLVLDLWSEVQFDARFV